MLRTLYETFQHWTRNGSAFVYSDPHFDDIDCNLMDPNWISPQEQIDIINNLVHKSDTFICLGDVGNVEWVKKIRARYKVLITGNHDGGAENYKKKIISNACMYPNCKQIDIGIDCDTCELNKIKTNNLFDEVYTGPLMISDKIILSHEPIPNINWALNICGHDHSGSCNDSYHYCVCSNTINYTPVNLKDIINSGILNKIDSLHRLTINNATEKSLRRK